MSKKTEFTVVRIIYVAALVLASLLLISPFYIPIIFGATLSLSLYPTLLRLETLGMRRNRAAALITILFTVIISIPVGFFLVKGTLAVTQQLEKINHDEKLKEQGVTEIVTSLRGDLVDYVQGLARKYEFMDFLTPQKIEIYLNTINSFLLRFFQGLAYSVPVLFMYLLITILCIYSFLSKAEGTRSFLQSISGFNDERMDQLSKIFIRDSRQVYLSNIVTGGIQSLMVALGVSFLGLGDFFLVFFVTLILSFIPVIGAAPVAFCFAIYAFLIKDEPTYAIILAVLGGVTGLADNILRPWLASFGESRIPSVVSFIFVIGGALLFGFPGLFIGLLVGSIAYDTLPIFWEELGKSQKNLE